MSYRAPVRDIAFALDAVAGIGQVAATGAFPDYDADVASAVLEAAGQFSEEVLAPLNRIGDQQGSTYANGAVTAAPRSPRTNQALTPLAPALRPAI